MTDYDILAAIFNNCDPVIPASERFYADCAAGRGGYTFATKFCEDLYRTHSRVISAEAVQEKTPSGEPARYLRALFTGHQGGGKSSELAHLRNRLSVKTPLPGKSRFFPVFVNMREYLDEFDAGLEDILLAIVAEVASAFHEEGIELQGTLLAQRLRQLKELALGEGETGEGEFNLGIIKLKISRLRIANESRHKVRAALSGQTSRIIEEINAVFAEARTRLRSAKPKEGGASYADFVLIVDALDRIYRYGGKESPDESQKRLFLDDAPALTALNAHCVFTVALPVARAYSADLRLAYGTLPKVLPLVKVEKREPKHEPYIPGRERLLELLGKRLPDGVNLVRVFTDAALELLLYYSGGHIRNLLSYTRESITFANDTLPIDERAIRKAVGQTVGADVLALRPEDWNALAALERADGYEWNAHTADGRRLLEQLFVLEYVNGGDGEGLDEELYWYAVNPPLRELRAFRNALAVRDKQSSLESRPDTGE